MANAPARLEVKDYVPLRDVQMDEAAQVYLTLTPGSESQAKAAAEIERMGGHLRKKELALCGAHVKVLRVEGTKADNNIRLLVQTVGHPAPGLPAASASSTAEMTEQRASPFSAACPPQPESLRSSESGKRSEVEPMDVETGRAAKREIETQREAGREDGAERKRPREAPPTENYNVRSLAEVPAGELDDPTSSASSMPPLVPPAAREPGREGRRTTIVSNAVTIDANWGALTFYQFDVHFWFEKALQPLPGEKPKPISRGNADALQSKLESLFRHDAPSGRAVKGFYDMNKIVFALAPLPSAISPSSDAAREGWSCDGAGGCEVILHEGRDGKPPQTATLKQVAILPMSELDTCAPGDLTFRQYIAPLDVALRPDPFRLKCLKGAYYDENARAAWAAIKRVGREENTSIWLGYRQKIVETVKGRMLFVDTAATAVHHPANLLSFIASHLGKSPHSLTFQQVKDAESKLRCYEGLNKRPRLSSKHSSREYKLCGLTDVPFGECTMQDDEKRCERKVSDWWAEHHPQIRLDRSLALPGVCTKNKSKDASKIIPVLPMEILSLEGNEPRMTSDLTRELMSIACLKPAERFEKINEVVYDVGRRMPNGFELGRQPERIPARILDSPRLIYSDMGGKRPREVTARDGQWNLQSGGGDLGFVSPGEKCRNWLVLNLASRDLRPSQVDDFLNMFKRMARDRGIHLGEEKIEAPAFGERKPQKREVENWLDQKNAECESVTVYPLDLVFAFMPNAPAGTGEGYLYPALKRWGETQTGIAVQCVKASKLLSGSRPNLTSPQYHAGVLLKLNLKLGGENVRLGANRLQLMRDQPTMVCGVDVHHSPPGASKPSWAALVASYDPECSKYMTLVTEQKEREEVLSCLEENMRLCIQQFYDHNTCYPKRIIFYRDGVAHNQFLRVAEQEVGHISLVLEQLGMLGTELIFVVVQKKTNARFALSPRDGGFVPKMGGGKGGGGKGAKGGKGGKGGGKGGSGDDLGNVPAGTVVDCGITDKGGFDFYMVSQHSGMGTARPSHYHVLKCPASLTQDEIQTFTFDLCHVYARCTKIASRPAPIYYAHLAAFHAPWYERDFFEEEHQNWDARSTSSRGSGGTSSSNRSSYAPVHKKQCLRLYQA